MQFRRSELGVSEREFISAQSPFNKCRRAIHRFRDRRFGKAGSFEKNAFAFEVLEHRQLLTGTWTTLTNRVPNSDGAQNAVVLSDGTIMVHGGQDSASNKWYRLTPNNGNYVTGTWTTLASSPTYRLFDATEVLTNGNVMVLGGEYSGSGTSDTAINTGEIYNPVTNTWAAMANFPQSNFGDDPTETLPNGNVLAGYIFGPQTYIYNPAANTWAATGTKLQSDQSDEEAWVKLPDGSILSYNVFSSINSTPTAQRYIPSTATWVTAGALPAKLSAVSVGYELGPGFLLPDGRAFYTGGTNATAYYTPSTNTWTAGPPMPNGDVMADAPGAVLPNGNLLLAMSPLGTLNSSGAYSFPGPTYLYELNPATNVYTSVTPSLSGFSLNSNSYTSTFLVLPTGQVMMFNETGTIAVYTESGSPVAAAVPVVTGITNTSTTGVYTLSGTNLNGINEGAAYGDDNEMASNYPLVRLTDSSGNITYARTSNWSLTGVFGGAETVTFTLPAADTAGAYILQSVANGVASSPMLAVLVNANTTTNVGLQMDSNPLYVDVVGNGTIESVFAISSFSSIEIVGDDAGDTISVNLNNSAGSTITTIVAGSAADTININQTSSTGPVVISPSAGSDAINVGTAGDGTAIAQFLASQQIGLLTIGSGGKASLSSGGQKVLQTNGVATTGTGVLDLTNNNMVIHGGNLTLLTPELASAYNGSAGAWTGPGITSSTAAADTSHLTAIGMILNSNGATPFEGVAAIQTDVLIKYTYYGDTNLDGNVDGSDYTRIDFGYLTQATTWSNGDFNYSGNIDGSDYTLIDNTFNTQGAILSATVATQKVIPMAKLNPAEPRQSSRISAPSTENVNAYSKFTNSPTPIALPRSTTFASQAPIAFSGLELWSETIERPREDLIQDHTHDHTHDLPMIVEDFR